MQTAQQIPAVQQFNARHIAPMVSTEAFQLTDDEARRQCVVFLLPPSVTGLDMEIYAACEPVAAWQWLQPGALVVRTTRNEWEDEVDNSRSVAIETEVARVLEVDKKARAISFVPETGNALSETWQVAEITGMWLIGRTAAAQQARMAA